MDKVPFTIYITFMLFEVSSLVSHDLCTYFMVIYIRSLNLLPFRSLVHMTFYIV